MRNEHRQSAGSGLLLGMAAGAALGAASVVAMNQNPRQVKRTARKLAKGAEHAVTQLDEMVSGFVERKMDLPHGSMCGSTFWVGQTVTFCSRCTSGRWC